MKSCSLSSDTSRSLSFVAFSSSLQIEFIKQARRSSIAKVPFGQLVTTYTLFNGIHADFQEIHAETLEIHHIVS
jgi:hypothetical protein